MSRVLLSHPASALANYYGERALRALRALADVRINETDIEWTLDELVDAANDCELIVSYRKTAAGAELFSRLPKLQAFLRCAVDIRNIDVEAASREGILVTQATAGFMASVSEWVIGVIIDLSRNISAASTAYHAGTPPAAVMGLELRGATLGIIGYGQIGRCLADLALAFGMRVLVADPHRPVHDARLQPVDLARLLAESDHVVCLANATAENENLMNADAFAAMKPSAFFINPSRGDLVDEAALAHALASGRIAGCALDVGRAPDQMPSPWLARHPRVIATPHVGGLTQPAIEHQAMETVAQVAEILQGQLPAGAVNPAHARRLRSVHPAG